MSPGRGLRLALSLTVSVLALGVTLWIADLQSLRDLDERVRWSQFPAVAMIVASILAAFAWRWRSLLDRKLGYLESIRVCALGLGGNQVLPLRGGDALRAILSARAVPGVSLHRTVSALAMEKIFDLIAVAAAGLAATASLLPTNAYADVGVIWVAAIIVVAAAVVILMAGSGLLASTLRAVARAVRLPPRVYRHLASPVRHLYLLASPARIAGLAGQTALVWLVLNLLAFLVIARFVGIALSAEESLVLMFAAALGLAIPAAPSGLGTLHAAIVSAFVLLGRPAADGLVLAVAIHGVFFAGFCLAGAAALAWSTHRFGRRAISETKT